MFRSFCRRLPEICMWMGVSLLLIEFICFILQLSRRISALIKFNWLFEFMQRYVTQCNYQSYQLRIGLPLRYLPFVSYSFVFFFYMRCFLDEVPLNVSYHSYCQCIIVFIQILNCQVMNPPNLKKTKHHTYTLVSKVGSGNFGQAFLVTSNIDSNRYIIKKIKLENRTQQSKQQVLKEIKLMQQLNHCYIIRYHESFVKERSVCIVMEYAEKGDLEKYLEKRRNDNKPLTEQQVIEWLIQLLLGLKYIHEKKIVHRDLKPDNIFISNNNELKIGDFGISKLMNETFDMAKTKIGTPFIMAPEIWDNMKYNQKSDIWSLGCVLYKLMMLKYPFQADNSGALMVKILTQKIPPVTGNYSPQLKGLVHQMLEVQAQNRPSAHKILEKPFIKKYFGKTLQKTINLYDQNYNSNDGIKRQHSVNRLSKKRSSSSLSTSMVGKSLGADEYLKIVEYKQNYPMLLEENRVLKQEVANMKKEKEILQDKTQLLLGRLRESSFSPQQIICEFQQHILNYLYP